MSIPVDKYLSKDYFVNNPTWDIEDSPWKAHYISDILGDHKIIPASVCDLGCGAGSVLAQLRQNYPSSELVGYDIAPGAASFWPQHKQEKIDFFLGDFFNLNKRTYDVILLLDVIEHVADPFCFLDSLVDKAKYIILHIPLDLSAVNVWREKPILNARKKTGHINYFTKNLALSLIKECGLKIVEWRYSEAAFSLARRSLKTRLANIPRKIFYAINKEMGVRVLGGETLFVLARGKG